MDSLVANYESDSDSQYSDDETTGKDNEIKEDDKVGKNYLIDAISSGEEDNADSSNIEQSSKPRSPVNQETPKLPPPLLDTKVASSITANSSQNSVFVSHFQKQEDAKLSILQKHVKVTEIEKRNEIGGKKVCWNYRKGKCRKGHRCPFAHDNDIPLPMSDNQDTDNPTEHQGSVQLGTGYFNHFKESTGQAVELNDDDSYMSNLKRKKKHGVGDHLVPPKRALNDLQKQRSHERPWTVNHN